MEILNEIKFSMPSLSVNESSARAAVSSFIVQADPTVEELSDIRTAVSEAVTNAVVHAYRGTSGMIELTVKLLRRSCDIIILIFRIAAEEIAERILDHVFLILLGTVAPVGILKDAFVIAARNDRCVTYVVHVTDRIIRTRAEINERFRSVLLVGITLDAAFQHDPAVKINIR